MLTPGEDVNKNPNGDNVTGIRRRRAGVYKMVDITDGMLFKNNGFLSTLNIGKRYHLHTMPRNYKKIGVTAKFRYNEIYIKNALKAVTRGQMSIRAASTNYGVPYTTLHIKYAAHVKGEEQRIIGGQPVLSEIEEKKIVKIYLRTFWFVQSRMTF
ncbi:uncharacterized protein LOC114338979 [Diabrotica virgifera virgifera]|uniref:HTH psq-type domain-containing protein n=1 Tax=Diabrotica virgifera virgifera TaxID=50390 RepID=A0ABM5IWI7_DIAVI|nr:uncharacterized protein LOC114338979 [Diabrotica virgifera virgifera]